MADWSEFVGWAEQLVDAPDLDSDERRYKLVAGERWKEALEAARGETAEWPALLRRAAGSGNLVDPFAQTWLRNQIDEVGNHPALLMYSLATLLA